MATKSDVAERKAEQTSVRSGNDGVETMVCTMTAGERRQVLHSACIVLPDGHPVKSQAALILETVRGTGENSADDATDTAIKETAIAAWRAVEALKEANRRELNQLIEDFRNGAIAKMLRHLSHGVVESIELKELEKEFEGGHGHHPDLEARVHFHGRSEITGPGSLHFRELANRTARGAAAGDEGWTYWLDVLVGYLLKNDHQGEHIQMISGCTLVRPDGTTYENHPGETKHGEHYGIHGVFKASAHCCSWLRRDGWRQQQTGTNGQSRTIAKTTEPKLMTATSDGNMAGSLARRRGFPVDIGRHNAIADAVERHSSGWRNGSRAWRNDSRLASISSDLDRDEVGIPKNWRTGKGMSLNGMKLRSWHEAFELGYKKLITDQIRYSLKIVLRDSAATGN